MGEKGVATAALVALGVLAVLSRTSRVVDAVMTWLMIALVVVPLVWLAVLWVVDEIQLWWECRLSRENIRAEPQGELLELEAAPEDVR